MENHFFFFNVKKRDKVENLVEKLQGHSLHLETKSSY